MLKNSHFTVDNNNQLSQFDWSHILNKRSNNIYSSQWQRTKTGWQKLEFSVHLQQ